jgi:hypothetical protein
MTGANNFFLLDGIFRNNYSIPDRGTQTFPWVRKVLETKSLSYFPEIQDLKKKMPLHVLRVCLFFEKHIQCRTTPQIGRENISQYISLAIELKYDLINTICFYRWHTYIIFR